MITLPCRPNRVHNTAHPLNELQLARISQILNDGIADETHLDA